MGEVGAFVAPSPFSFGPADPVVPVGTDHEITWKGFRVLLSTAGTGGVEEKKKEELSPSNMMLV